MAAPVTDRSPVTGAPETGDRRPSGAPPPEAARRGVLRITDGAAAHVVEGVLAERAPHVRDPDVHVTSLTDDAVEVAVDLGLEYPTAPLRSVLRDLRELVADEGGRLLGRPVRRVDLRVTDLVVDPPRDQRRVV